MGPVRAGDRRRGREPQFARKDPGGVDQFTQPAPGIRYQVVEPGYTFFSLHPTLVYVP